MLFRYKKNEHGGLVKTAEVHTKHEHNIDLSLIDQDAVRIVQRLQRGGFTAYLVGGAVRDLLVGKRPKDFDLVTSAEPNQIRKLFRNSRIIGKRFRLVHVFFKDDKIIEVSTFRSIEAGTFNNVFGTIEEDALRRDFSINALYYDPVQEQLIDFVGGFRDIKARKLKPLIPMKTIFTEDPVRMIRAVKYARSTGCKMGFFFKRAIKKSAPLLGEVSDSRLSEEAFKILQGGWSAPLIKDLASFGLLVSVFPRLAILLADPSRDAFQKRFFASLELLDTSVREHHEGRRSIQLSYFLADYLFMVSPLAEAKRIDFAQAYHDLKDFLKPITPPNVEVERALVYLLRKRSLYVREGGLGHIDHQIKTDDPGEYAKEIEKLRDSRDGRRRRRPPLAAGPGTTVSQTSPDPRRQATKPQTPILGHESDSAAPKKRRRPRKKKIPGAVNPPQA